MRTIREDFLIKVVGTQESDDSRQETISLMTRGEFTRKDHCFYITYKESDTTGYAGCTTTVKAEADGSKASMLRFGPAPGQLIVEKGVRHICHYETGQGSLSLGLTADEIDCGLNDEGGHLRFSYLLDLGEETLSHNTVDITVRRA